jgi:tetratricopeptide (TPR) repeat protein
MPIRRLPSRVTRGQRPGGARGRLIVLAISFAGWAAVGSGCLVTPLQSPNAAPTSLPQIPEGASTDVAAQIQPSGPATDFHAEATDRQAFQVHIDFGRVFETQGNFDGAVFEYQEAITVVETRRRGSLGPADRALAHRRMAGALDRLGRFAQAEAHYQKALALSPKDPKIWNDVGYSYYLQGRWPDAERALRTAAELAPDDERIRINLGLTLAAAGKTTEALPLLSQSTGDATGHANLGYLLAATGQIDLARQQYEIALAQRPDMVLARRALARLDRQQQNGATPSASDGRLAEKPRPAGHSLDSHIQPAAATAPKIPAAATAPKIPAAATARKIPAAATAPKIPAAATARKIPAAATARKIPAAATATKIPAPRTWSVPQPTRAPAVVRTPAATPSESANLADPLKWPSQPPR